MKLSIDSIDNKVKSAIVDIGKNNGYVEVFVFKGVVHLNVFNKQGDVLHAWAETTKSLRSPYAITTVVPDLSDEVVTPKEVSHAI